jgi:hypothetical protein
MKTDKTRSMVVNSILWKDDKCEPCPFCMAIHFQFVKVLSFGSKRINSENTPKGEILICNTAYYLNYFVTSVLRGTR